jgi:pSer/pThr/pTyr-binding forkhead associated (FHA) protein
MMNLVLVMFTEKGERRDFPVTRTRTLIGRTTECDLQIPLSDVSRRHCELRIKNDKVAVRDLGSSNGTYINKKRIQQEEIEAGETLTIGPVIFTVVINDVPEVIKPIPTILQHKKKKSDSTAATAPKEDTGSVDLAGSGEMQIMDDPGLSGSSMPVELGELSKQHKKKPANG